MKKPKPAICKLCGKPHCGATMQVIITIDGKLTQATADRMKAIFDATRKEFPT